TWTGNKAAVSIDTDLRSYFQFPNLAAAIKNAHQNILRPCAIGDGIATVGLNGGMTIALAPIAGSQQNSKQADYQQTGLPGSAAYGHCVRASCGNVRESPSIYESRHILTIPKTSYSQSIKTGENNRRS